MKSVLFHTLQYRSVLELVANGLAACYQRARGAFHSLPRGLRISVNIYFFILNGATAGQSSFRNTYESIHHFLI